MDVQAAIRSATTADHHVWRTMFEEYRSVGGLNPDDVVVSRVWSWITDPAHPVEALLAEADGEPLGFAHVRRFPRPILADEGLHLDDLFTRPQARGRGLARALLAHLEAEVDRGAVSVVRWTTRTGNVIARGLYDQVAQVSDSVIYNMG